MTQLESARQGIITAEMVRVAIRGNVKPAFSRAGAVRTVRGGARDGR